jgi:GNAT superfamily N-acetyltransferase
MQFRGQMSAYAQMFPNSCCHVVMLDGKPSGRLWVAMLESEYHLVDIAVHPSLQSKGIGTALIQRLQQEAARARLPIRCCVFRFNPGSLRVREDLMHYYLEWRSVAIL